MQVNFKRAKLGLLYLRTLLQTVLRFYNTFTVAIHLIEPILRVRVDKTTIQRSQRIAILLLHLDLQAFVRATVEDFIRKVVQCKYNSRHLVASSRRSINRNEEGEQLHCSFFAHFNYAIQSLTNKCVHLHDFYATFYAPKCTLE